ncbi:MAG: hypothetical protein IPN94_02225 [Sphingobacteriales bacterium]|nr:hypothetical protein [Sphingobacteriales bacterium]
MAIRAENIGQGLYGLKVKNARVLDRKIAEYYTQNNSNIGQNRQCQCRKTRR